MKNSSPTKKSGKSSSAAPTTQRASKAKATASTKASKAKSPSRAAPASPEPLIAQVQAAIAKLPLAKNMSVLVGAKAAVIRLTGTASAQFKAQAESAALQVRGVQSVVNKIVVPRKSLGCDPETERECFCNGGVTCIPIDRDCPDCIPDEH